MSQAGLGNTSFISYALPFQADRAVTLRFPTDDGGGLPTTSLADDGYRTTAINEDGGGPPTTAITDDGINPPPSCQCPPPYILQQLLQCLLRLWQQLLGGFGGGGLFGGGGFGGGDLFGAGINAPAGGGGQPRFV